MEHSFLSWKGWVHQVKHQSGLKATFNTDHMQSTWLGISHSELITTQGVPQGSILGPLQFSLYMNDLPSVVKFSSIESYVDDTWVYLLFSSQDIDSCLT